MNTLQIKELAQNIKHDKPLLNTYLELLTNLKKYINSHKLYNDNSSKRDLLQSCSELRIFLTNNNCIMTDYETINNFNTQLEDYKTNFNIIDNKSELYLKLEKTANFT